MDKKIKITCNKTEEKTPTERASKIGCDVHDQLKMLSIQETKELNSLYTEALNMLFKVKKLLQIATPND